MASLVKKCSGVVLALVVGLALSTPSSAAEFTGCGQDGSCAVLSLPINMDFNVARDTPNEKVWIGGGPTGSVSVFYHPNSPSGFDRCGIFVDRLKSLGAKILGERTEFTEIDGLETTLKIYGTEDDRGKLAVFSQMYCLDGLSSANGQHFQNWTILSQTSDRTSEIMGTAFLLLIQKAKVSLR